MRYVDQAVGVLTSIFEHGHALPATKVQRLAREQGVRDYALKEARKKLRIESVRPPAELCPARW